jgi:hypothetical protein
MSQWGAKTLADKGYTYEQILTYFYSGVQLADMPQSLGGRGKVIPTSKKASKAQAEDNSGNEAVEIGAPKFAPGR